MGSYLLPQNKMLTIMQHKIVKLSHLNIKLHRDLNHKLLSFFVMIDYIPCRVELINREMTFDFLNNVILIWVRCYFIYAIPNIPPFLTNNLSKFSSETRVHTSVKKWIDCIGYVKQKRTTTIICSLSALNSSSTFRGIFGTKCKRLKSTMIHIGIQQTMKAKTTTKRDLLILISRALMIGEVCLKDDVSILCCCIFFAAFIANAVIVKGVKKNNEMTMK